MGFNQFGNPFGIGFNGGAFGRGGATKQGVLEKIGIASDKVAFYQSFRKGKKGIKDAMTVRRASDSKTTVIPYRPNVAYNAPRNELHYTPTTWAEFTNPVNFTVVESYIKAIVGGVSSRAIINLKPNTKYGFLWNVRRNTRSANGYLHANNAGMSIGSDIPILSGVTGKMKSIKTTISTITTNYLSLYFDGGTGEIELGDIRIFELPTGSQIETDFTNLTADELNAKYPMVDCNGATFGTNAGVQKDRICNQFANGDGRYGTIGVASNHSSISNISNGFRLTGSGTNAVMFLYANRTSSTFKSSSSKKYFIKAKINSSLSSSGINIVSSNDVTFKSIDLLGQVIKGSDSWVKAIITQTDLGSGNLFIYFYQSFLNAATQNGKTLDVKYWSIVDMGDSSADPLYNYTESEMDAWLASQPQAIAVEGGYYLPPYGLCTGELDLDVVANFGGSSQLLLTQINGQDYAPVVNSTQSTATYQPKVWDNGLYYPFGLFDGTDDYLASDLPDVINAPCTWWAKVNHNNSDGFVFAKNTSGSADCQYGIEMTATTTYFVINGNNFTFSTPTNKDVIVALTWDGQNAIRYMVLNGVVTQFPSVPLSGALTSKPNKNIGCRSNIADGTSRFRFFKGEIQEIGIVTQVLTADQIQKLWKL